MQIHNPSKPKRKRIGLGNNRKVTKARSKQRVGQSGGELPLRQTFAIEKKAHITNMHKAYKKEIQKDLKEWGNSVDRGHALHYLRVSRQERNDAAILRTKEKAEVLLFAQQAQNLIAQDGCTRRNISQFLNELGYDTRYSGKNRTMFASPMDNLEIVVFKYVDVIPAVIDKFEDVPFAIVYSEKV